LRVDPEYDHGITGSLRIAHLGEALGLDVEVHACGPAHRHLMSAMRNSNFYELALVGPDCPNMVAPVYTCGYTDQLDCCGADGCVQVPSGPGLGVTYDWNFIRKNAIATRMYD
jgi:L-alanine-DL-glutamate epimerase-like enolase superfamily enzyme